MDKISIIIPAYNEEKRIGNTLNEYEKFFKNLKKQKKIDFEIIVVINNTSDKTPEIVKKYSKKYKEIRFLNFKQGGKGFAIIQGFKYALKRKNDLIGFVDADMSTSPEEYYKLILGINGFDGIIANRYSKDSFIKPKQPIKRILVSRIGNFIIRNLFLFPYRDTQCGAKIFKRKPIKDILPSLGITQWAFDIDLLYQLRKKGFKIKQNKTKWEDKEGSKLNLKKASLQMFLAIIQLRIINSPFKKLLKPLKYPIGLIWRIVR